MGSMKRVQLALALVVAGVLFTGTTVAADSTIELACVVGSDDPDFGATGEATLTNVHIVGGYNMYPYSREEWYEGDLTVTCRGLTRGATYSTPVGKSKADRRGNLVVQGTVEMVKSWTYVSDPNWPDTYYLVLDFSSDVQVDVARMSRKTSILLLTGVFVAPAGY